MGFTEQTIETLYEWFGKGNVYCSYITLFLFVIKPKKITTRPFNYFFYNLIFSTIFDGFAEYFHIHQIVPEYFDIIVPFYGINNIVFLGLFFVYFTTVHFSKYLHISIAVFSVIVLIVYLNARFEELYPVGYLIQSSIMIGYAIIGLRSVWLKEKKIFNSQPFLMIIIASLLAYLSSLLINVLLKSMQDVSVTFMHLFYAIKNGIWLIANLVFAWAIFKIKVKRKETS